MKDRTLSPGAAFALCIIPAVLFTGIGIFVSFRSVGGVFSQAALFVRNITFEDVSFLEGVKKAVFWDLIFCVAVALFAMSYPASVLPGGIIGLKTFFMGVSLGLAARCSAFGDAMGICFAVFVSNFLVLPLKILLFVASIRFSRHVARLPSDDRAGEFVRFSFRILVFFLLMCIAQCVQIGIGIWVLGA